MKLILKQKLKFCTKEFLKVLNFILLATVIILVILLTKYKPIYAVKIEGKEIGYTDNKEELQNTILDNIQECKIRNIYEAKIKEEPEYELKLVTKTQETNESEILIGIQKDMEITYKYFEISLEQEKIDKVDTLEEAEKIVKKVKEKDPKVDIQYIEHHTQNEEELKTNNVQIAEEKVLQKLNLIEEEKQKTMINDVKLAVVPVQGVITSRYGVSSRLRKSTHTGLDIAVTKGTPIKAIASGTIISATYTGAYGNLVKIDHGNGVETWYAHTNTMNVKKGQKINEGDIIATVGSTGNSTGPHLHLEIRVNGQHIDPQKYFYEQ